ncbi:MAG: P-II family nitrogen regulator [Candidatus Nitrosotenuis sp.]
MLKIEAVIRTIKLQEVKKELERIGIVTFSSFEVRISGLAHEMTSDRKPGSFKTSALIPKIKIEVICMEKDADRIIEAIVNGARTGRVGDGIVYVCPISYLMKIKNGRLNDQAV